MSNFENILRKKLLEAIEKEKINLLQEKKSKAAAAKDTNKLSQGTTTSGDKLLDISNISRSLIRGTESSSRTVTVEDAFKTLRQNNPYISALKSSFSAENLVKALDFYFTPDDSLLKAECTGLGSVLTKQLVLDAYYSIFQEYNSKVAGFVNENFVSGLLGGQTISVDKNIDEDDENVDVPNIADFKIGDVGISLKTASSQGKLAGSFKNLLRSLGIKFRMKTTSSNLRNDSDFMANKGGLYYLLFLKPNADEHTISCFKVDRDYITEKLKNYLDSNDGYYVFKDKTQMNAAALTAAPFLGKDFKSLLKGGAKSKFAASEIIRDKTTIDLKNKILLDSGKENQNKIIGTLNALNQFYSIYSNAVMEFAKDPNIGNLESLKQKLEIASQFKPEELLSNKC